MNTPETTRKIQTLQGLVERLSAPDLTASEAEQLRPRLLGLLDEARQDGDAWPVAAGGPLVDRPIGRPLACSCWLA